MGGRCWSSLACMIASRTSTDEMKVRDLRVSDA